MKIQAQVSSPSVWYPGLSSPACSPLPACLQCWRGVGEQAEHILPFPRTAMSSLEERERLLTGSCCTQPAEGLLLTARWGQTDRQTGTHMVGCGGWQLPLPAPSITAADATSGSNKRGRKRQTKPKALSNFPSQLIASGWLGCSQCCCSGPRWKRGDPQITEGKTTSTSMEPTHPPGRKCSKFGGSEVIWSHSAMFFPCSQKERTWPFVQSKLPRCSSTLLILLLLAWGVLALGKYLGALQ